MLRQTLKSRTINRLVNACYTRYRMEHRRGMTTQTTGADFMSSFMATATSILSWMGRSARNRVTTYSIIVGVAACGLTFRSLGLGRSLYLDETWVANAAIAPSLAGMFYYDAWLQTSPPLFMFLVRSVVHILGLTNSVLRLIPWLMGILSIVSMAILVRRLLSQQYALLAWTMFVLSPVAIRYSSVLKQYSSELMATTVILLVCTIYL